MSDKLLLTPAEAAALVGMSERQLYLAVKRGALSTVKPSGVTGRRFYRREALLAFIEGATVSGGAS